MTEYTNKDYQLLSLIVKNNGSIPYQYRTDDFADIAERGLVRKIESKTQSSYVHTIKNSRNTSIVIRDIKEVWVLNKEAEKYITTRLIIEGFRGITISAKYSNFPEQVLELDTSQIINMKDVFNWCDLNGISLRQFLWVSRKLYFYTPEELMIFQLKWC